MIARFESPALRRPPRGLNALGNHTFFPDGAEAVRIRFEVEGERARPVTVHDPGLLARGVRLP